MDNKKKILYASIAFITIVGVIFIGNIFSQIKGDKIARNVYIEDTYVGGLTIDEANKKISEKYIEEDIVLNYEKKKINIKSSEIDLKYDLDKSVKNAFEINRSKDTLSNVKETIKLMFGYKQSLDIEVIYDESKLNSKLDDISKDINKKSKNASLDIKDDEFIISKEEYGIKIDKEKSLVEIEKNIKNNEFEIKLIVDILEPKIKEEDLVKIDTLLGSYTTKFNSAVYGRSHNIKVAANSTSDVILMPNDEFSYNKHTGPRDVENGYKNAPVIVAGELQEGIGGGVCQVSSTLYNAVLYSGVEIVKVQNHSIPSNYIQKGRDATVTDSGIDFIFKNSYENPIYINNYVKGNTVTCEIYGSSKDKSDIEIETTVDEVIYSTYKKVNDDTLLEGQEEIVEEYRNGYTVSTYRIYEQDKNDSNKVKVATSYYPKKEGVISVGTLEKQENKEKEESKQQDKKDKQDEEKDDNKDKEKDNDKDIINEDE